MMLQEISLADAQEAQPQADIYRTDGYTNYPMEDMQAAAISDNYLPVGSLIPKTPSLSEASPSHSPSEAQQQQPAATGHTAEAPQPQPEASPLSLAQSWAKFVRGADEKLAAWANPAALTAAAAAGSEAATLEGQSTQERVEQTRSVEPVLDTMNEWNYYGFEHSRLRPWVNTFIDRVKGMLGEKLSSRLQAAWDLPQQLLNAASSQHAESLSQMSKQQLDEFQASELDIELPKPHPGPPPAAHDKESETSGTIVSETNQPLSTTQADIIDIIAPSKTKVSSDLALMAGQRSIKSSTPMMTIFKASTLMDDSITSIQIEEPGLTPDQRDPRDPRQATNPLQPASAHFRLSQIAGPQNRPGLHWEPEDSQGPQRGSQQPQAEPYDGYWLEARPALGTTARIDSDRAMPVTATYELQLVLGSITPTSKVVSRPPIMLTSA